uniref:Large ribosomal subunit protein mL53 n=1 Tax=Strigamia maritima TaxID=126957 RepID=T1J6T0_STRMM
MSIATIDRNLYFPLKKAIREHIKKINFRPIKQILFTFDPFHHSVNSTRQFLYHISSHKVHRTNPLCRLKTNIVNDRSDPSVAFTLANGENVVIKSSNFSLIELFELYQKYIAVHDVAPTTDSKALATTGKGKPSKGRK